MSAILRTERLVLRPYRDIDFADIHAYGSNPAVVQYMIWGPSTEAESREFLQRVQEQNAADPRLHYDWGITLQDEDRVIGGCGLYLPRAGSPNGELGYCLHPAYWGQGIMPEACRALLGVGFGEMRLHRIFARCHPDNPKSARVMEKIGMQYEGRLRETEWVKGAWWDYLQYSILEPEQLAKA